MKKRTFIALGTGLLVLMLVSGCATSPGRIGQDPQRYDGKLVTVRGTVGRSFRIPLIDISVFLLENSGDAVPVVSTREDRDKGSPVRVRGEVWAFPERGMNEDSAAAVKALERFLVDQDLVARDRARQMSAVVLTAVRELAGGLGHLWFIIEN